MHKPDSDAFDDDDDDLFGDEADDFGLPVAAGVEKPVSSVTTGSMKRPWRVLIVDDEEDVHTLTNFVMAEVEFDGACVELLHAYSAEEAKQLCANEEDIALAFVDVVMEHDHAGLELVEYIRDSLGNQQMRLILRTGQPGQAPEEQVIYNYDINDYKQKSELTSSKLYTAVITSLRAYQNIRSLERNRRGLHQIIDACSTLANLGSMQQFMTGLLDQFNALFRLNNDSVIAHSTIMDDGSISPFIIMAGIGQYAKAIGKPVDEYFPPEVTDVACTHESGFHRFRSDHYAGLSIAPNGMRSLIILNGRFPLSTDDRELLELFTTSIAVMFENVRGSELLREELQRRQDAENQLERANESLEVKVVERTADLQAEVERRCRIERDLIVAKDHAENANRVKGEFLANMSHEIRTPMNGILGMSELLMDMDLNDEQSEFVNIIRQSGNALLGIINDILDFSKIEAGKMNLENIPFDLLTVVEEVAVLLAAKARDAGLQLYLQYSPDTPRYLQGDPTRIRQVITNLVGNAVKFTKQGWVTVSIQPLPDRCSAHSSMIEVRVTDTGIGIDQEMQDMIFSKFTQAEASTTREFGGTGLGLSICRDLVHLMGGEIAVESRPGKGSTFSFTLVLDNDSSAQQVSLDCFEEHQRPTVVVIGDNQHEAREVARWMRASRARVGLFEQAAELESALLDGNLNAVDVVIYCYQDLVTFDRFREEIQAIWEDATAPVQAMVVSQWEMSAAEELHARGIHQILYRPVRLSQIVARIKEVWQLETCKLSAASPTGLTLMQERQQQIQGRVLLVEDNVVNENVCRSFIEHLGADVISARDGASACSAFMTGAFDLVLMDYYLPDMEGPEITERMRAWEQQQGREQTPVIGLTAADISDVRQDSLKAGMQDVLLKPVDRDALEKVVREHCSARAVS